MMDTAIRWSEESYCIKKKVGAVAARDGHILDHGYNGTLSGHHNICECTATFSSKDEYLPHKDSKWVTECPECQGSGRTWLSPGYSEDCHFCNSVGYLMVLDKTDDFTMHAEANIIQNCAAEGIALKGSTFYITLAPCKDCAKLIAGVKAKAVYYREEWKNSKGIEYLEKCKIPCTQLDR